MKYRSNQEGVYSRKLTNDEVINLCSKNNPNSFSPVEIKRSYTKNLKTNLIVAPLYQAYSLAIQYMSKWFYAKFDNAKGNNFFKHKYLDASHVMDQMNHYTIRELIKSNKPSAHIMVEDETDYNRNGVDLHNLGVTLYNNRARYQDAFFIDRDMDTFISVCFQEIKMNFTFSIRLATKSVQDDVFALCDMAFRAGGSEKHYIDIDYPIPHELIGQIACDKGMCNEDGKYSVNDMLKYFNMHSKLALMYKFNHATGNMEFFLRIPKCRVLIRTSPVAKNPGIQRNMTFNDFVVQFRSEVYMPAIKFFAYYSFVERDHITSYTKLDAKSLLFGCTSICNIPNNDEHGWPWEFRTHYTLATEEELSKLKNKELISIPLDDPKDPMFIDELREVIESTKSIAISPSAFVNIKAFNYLKYIPTEINWANMTLNFLEPLTTAEIYLVVYINKLYMHSTLGDLKLYRSARLRPYNNHIGPQLELGTKVPDLGQ